MSHTEMCSGTKYFNVYLTFLSAFEVSRASPDLVREMGGWWSRRDLLPSVALVLPCRDGQRGWESPAEAKLVLSAILWEKKRTEK